MSHTDSAIVKLALNRLAGRPVTCPRCRIVENPRGDVALCHVCREPGRVDTFVAENGHLYCSPRCYARHESI